MWQSIFVVSQNVGFSSNLYYDKNSIYKSSSEKESVPNGTYLSKK